MFKHKFLVLIVPFFILILLLLFAFYRSTQQEKLISDENGSYQKFSLTLEDGWNKQDVSNTYTLSKGEYELVISQIEGSGEECVFEGNFDPEKEQQDFRMMKYKELETEIGKFRYFSLTQDGGKNTFSFCGPAIGEKNSEDFFILTNIGFIQFITPLSPELRLIKEMESMVQSLKAV